MQVSILGTGNMAKAIIKGLEGKCELEIIGRDENKLSLIKEQFPLVKILKLENNLNIENKNIIFCVKPYAIDFISLSGVANSFISILAGTKLETLQEKYKAKYYARAMPNIGASYGASTTAIFGDIEIKEQALKIFSEIGESIWLETEKEIDIATAIIGSAPAFLALIAESIVDTGVLLGLKHNNSLALTQGLFNSFLPLFKNIDTLKIKEQITSPGGTTAQGIFSLETSGARGVIMQAIKDTYDKANSISKS
jgi:pyrroline-5-carboxylate reductase